MYNVWMHCKWKELNYCKWTWFESVSCSVAECSLSWNAHAPWITMREREREWMAKERLTLSWRTSVTRVWRWSLNLDNLSSSIFSLQSFSHPRQQFGVRTLLLASPCSLCLGSRCTRPLRRATKFASPYIWFSSSATMGNYVWLCYFQSFKIN